MANDHVLACLLALNALRVSEACGADLTDLALANGHRVVGVVGKGSQPALIPLAPRTSRAIDAAVGERTDGALLARADDSRRDRHAAMTAALDGNPTYIVATYLAGATGAR